MPGKQAKLIIYTGISALFCLALFVAAHAQTAADIQSKIDARNQDIENLQKEISTYQKQIDSLGSQADTLASKIQSLKLTQKKLEANIAVTQDEIASKNLEIDQLKTKITGKEGSISDDQRIVAQAFKAIGQSGDKSLVEIILGTDSLSQTLDRLDRLGSLQKSLEDRINLLRGDRANLVTDKQSVEKVKSDLVALQSQLSNQRTVVLSTSAEQALLLKQTNQSESSYRSLLADRKAKQAAFQQEIDSYESQLHLLVSPNAIPKASPSILSWPLDSIVITQYFGNTPFATANPQIYNGAGHTGVDFGASIGTPVKAALSGEVIGVENTDLYPGCYSYGKWIMIKHQNGLSTLYGHLSLQTVSVGQKVSTGDIIGYSGNTGYTTGPHLHFGVYATAGTVIKLFTTSLHCQGATIPIADRSAYLNPMSYLPSLSQ